MDCSGLVTVWGVLIDVQLVHSPLAKLDVNDEEDDAQQETNATHCDVCNTQEVIFASKDACRGKDHALAATK